MGAGGSDLGSVLVLFFFFFFPVLVLLLICCVPLGKSFPLSEPQLLHL